jgi:Protein of unknown function (DUF2971)
MRVTPFSLDEHLAQQPPATLYHYTSLEALRSIIQSKSVWATNIFYLNDSSEYRHVLSAIAKRIETRLEKISDAKQQADLRQLLMIVSNEPYAPIYVASFSSHPDDLSQWRGYCPPGLGVCIGFDSAEMKAAIEKERGTLGSVIYFADENGESFDPLIDSVINGLPHTRLKLPKPIATGIDVSFAAPFYKNESFKSECEWRICIGRYLDIRQSVGKVNFRVGKSTLVPYKEIHFGEDNKGFISSLLIGPSPSLTLSVNAVKELLKSEGMDHVPVSGSTVPFRHW